MSALIPSLMISTIKFSSGVEQGCCCLAWAPQNQTLATQHQAGLWGTGPWRRKMSVLATTIDHRMIIVSPAVRGVKQHASSMLVPSNQFFPQCMGAAALVLA